MSLRTPAFPRLKMLGFVPHPSLREPVVLEPFLKIRFHGFETHTRSRTLPVPTADDTTLYRTAWALFEAEAWAGKPVRLIGLGLSRWAADLRVQPDLFAAADTPEPHRREGRLSETLDAIRRKFGSGYIQRGVYRRR